MNAPVPPVEPNPLAGSTWPLRGIATTPALGDHIGESTEMVPAPDAWEALDEGERRWARNVIRFAIEPAFRVASLDPSVVRTATAAGALLAALARLDGPAVVQRDARGVVEGLRDALDDVKAALLSKLYLHVVVDRINAALAAARAYLAGSPGTGDGTDGAETGGGA